MTNKLIVLALVCLLCSCASPPAKPPRYGLPEPPPVTEQPAATPPEHLPVPKPKMKITGKRIHWT